jgi:hypothetical protein
MIDIDYCDPNNSFQVWSEDNAIKNTNGGPIKLFHGTSKSFDTFNNPYAGKSWEMFSDSAEYAAEFAIGDGGNIMPVHLVMRKPLDLRSIEAVRGDARAKLLRVLDRSGVDISSLSKSLPYERDLFQIVNLAGHQSDFVDHLKKAGFDGVVMPDAHGELRATTYIVFEPTQIKSAIGNAGTFDPTDPSITDYRSLSPEEKMTRSLFDNINKQTLQTFRKPRP